MSLPLSAAAEGGDSLTFAEFNTCIALLGITSTLLGIVVTIVSVLITILPLINNKNKK